MVSSPVTSVMRFGRSLRTSRIGPRTEENDKRGFVGQPLCDPDKPYLSARPTALSPTFVRGIRECAH